MEMVRYWSVDAMVRVQRRLGACLVPDWYLFGISVVLMWCHLGADVELTLFW